MQKYVVIGGQYSVRLYGVFDSLHAAKVYASKHPEYWDNWQGWNVPNIYRLDQCRHYTDVKDAYGNHHDDFYIPQPNAVHWYKPYDSKHWVYIDY